MRIARAEDHYLFIKLAVSFPKDYKIENLLRLMQEEEEIQSIDV